MKMSPFQSALSLFLLTAALSAQNHAPVKEALAATPPMGWNSWNKFHMKIDDATVRAQADAMVSSGMKAAGYEYINIDEGWEGARDAQGNLSPNPGFPDMKALAAYVHSKGLKLGIYTSPGPKACGGSEGSYGHEEQDAKLFASWNIDYIKYDWCTAGTVYSQDQYPLVLKKMADAIGVARFISDDPYTVLKMSSFGTAFNFDGIWGGNMYAGGSGAILPNTITDRKSVV